MTGNILAGNTDPGLGEDLFDFPNQVVTATMNIVESPNGHTLDPATNRIGVDPMLGALGDHGGPVPSKALIVDPANPAKDQGSNVQGFLYDQNGHHRTLGSGTDGGATESENRAFVGVGDWFDPNNWDGLLLPGADAPAWISGEKTADLSAGHAADRDIIVDTGGSNTIRNGSSAAVTIGPDIAIGGAGFSINLDGDNAGFINQGALHADTAGGGLSFNLTNITNEGTVRVDAGANMRFIQSYTQTGGATQINGTVVTEIPINIQGGTLSGAGFVQILNGAAPNSDINVSGGATISPGNSIGTLTIDGNVTIGDGGHYLAELSEASSADLLQADHQGKVSGCPGRDLDLSSNNDFLDLVTLDPLTMGNRYLIATYTGNLTGIFDNVTPGFTADYNIPTQVNVIFSGLDIDFNNDNMVDNLDIDLMRLAVINQTSDSQFNVNGLGDPNIPDEADFDHLVVNLFSSGRGDGNLSRLRAL